MTRGMKAYLAAGALVLGFHAGGGALGWWRESPVKLENVFDMRGGSGGSSGWGGSGGFRGGK